ncbi:hypothetical protein [Nocardia sp. NPDC046763]|uniref:hypothetical protein n=1 Tax=Nocardia sp. NPDC046763 TaxID=3155256 RepID=UPI0033D361F5
MAEEGAQLIAAWREDRRWQRDISRHQDDRLFAARSDAYAHLLGSIEYWDAALFRPVRDRDVIPGDLDRLDAAYEAAIRGLGSVNLFAPEHVRAWILEAMRPRMDMTQMVARGADSDVKRMLDAWREAQIAYRTLRALMRADLGMDAEAAFLEHAGNNAPEHILPWANPELDGSTG